VAAPEVAAATAAPPPAQPPEPAAAPSTEERTALPERVRVTPKPAPRRVTAPTAPANEPETAEPAGPTEAGPSADGPAPVPLETAADSAPVDDDEDRADVRAKYEKDKGGFTFYDLAYWVDAAKLDDSRWTKDATVPAQPLHDRGLQLRAVWSNPASDVPGMTIEVLALKLLHEQRDGATVMSFSYPFDNLGEAVKCSDPDGIVNGFYEDWRRGAKDVDESACEPPRKSHHKVPKYECAAVGTVPDERAGGAVEQRVRREWYAWADGKQTATYVVQITYGPGLFDKEVLVEKGHDLVRNLRELKDKRARWE